MGQLLSKEFIPRVANSFLSKSMLLRRVVVVDLLFYVHCKHLKSCRDGQLT